VRAGRLDRRVAIQRKAVTPVIDADGNDITIWQSTGTAWVAIEPATTSESYSENEPVQTRFWTVTTRYRRDVDHNSRLLLKRDGFADRILDVLTVVDSTDQGWGERHRTLQLQCRERVV
jgi:SPP1 family predicted phage head-tail adaptor